MIEKIIIGALGVLCIFLICVICRQADRAEKEYEELFIAYEEEKTRRQTDKECSKFLLRHYKEQKDEEIKLLREALNGSEAKRKELCTRLWEEEKLT